MDVVAKGQAQRKVYLVIGNIEDQVHFHKYFNVWKHLSHIKTKNVNRGGKMTFLVPVLSATLKTIVTAFFTEKVIMFTALSILKYLSAKTTNKIDDKLVLLLEKQIAQKA